MKITEDAKSLIKAAFDFNDCDCLKVSQQQSCCGTSLQFELIKLQAGEKSVSIDGVPVMMDDQTQTRTEAVTLSAENGELTIQDDRPCCC